VRQYVQIPTFGGSEFRFETVTMVFSEVKDSTAEKVAQSPQKDAPAGCLCRGR
jgi:hypothetical protein